MGYQMPINRVKCRFLMGIDPDVDECGLIVYDREQVKWYCDQLELFALIDWVRTEFKPADLQTIIEAGWKNPGFHHVGGFPSTFKTWKEKSKLAYVASAAFDVGENFNVGKQLDKRLKALGYTTQLEAPESAKWDAALFKKKTGLAHGHNETIRDAARIMYDFI